MLLQMLERHFRFFHAITCQVRGLHSRANRAPHGKRNVRQLAKARLESVVSGQMDGTRFIRIVAAAEEVSSMHCSASPRLRGEDRGEGEDVILLFENSIGD